MGALIVFKVLPYMLFKIDSATVFDEWGPSLPSKFYVSTVASRTGLYWDWDWE
jgi:hypothetical protein